MSIGINTPRLLAAAKEFNIGKDTLLEFLEGKGFDTKSFKPNTKLSEEMYEALQEEFARDRAVKRKSEAMALPKAPSIDNIDKFEAGLSIAAKDKETASEKYSHQPTEEASATMEGAASGMPAQNGKADESLIAGTAKEETEDSPTAKQAEKTQEKGLQETIVPESQRKSKHEDKEANAETFPAAEEGTDSDENTPKKSKKEAVERNEEIPSKDKKHPKQAIENGENNEEVEPEHIEAKAPKLEGPRVLDKINLDDLNLSTRPKKVSAKKPESKKKNAPSADKNQTKQEAADIDETIKKQSEASKETPKVQQGEPTTREPIHIKTNTPKLEGPRIIGKINLPVNPSRPKPENNKEKRKRKRIPVDKKHSNAKPGTESTQGNNGKNKSKIHGGLGYNKRHENNIPQEIDAKKIQEKIKETQAKLSGSGTHNRNLKAKYRRNKREERAEKRAAEELQSEEKVIQVTEFISVSELANLLDVSFADIISKCMNLGIMVSINQRLDAEVIELVSSEFETTVEFINLEDHSEEEEEDEQDDEQDLEPRAPVVTIMGHVDHGKTSLLDYIRSSSVVAGEEGGITQHIGAYKVVTSSGKELTFLDTPGHEAFTAMRARGAKAADVAIIVIAADDAVMPQTREAISHAQAANLPMVFAINKIDKDGANPDKIKEQLSTMNILVEDWGGNYQCQEISAKKGINIEELLEKVLLEAELLDLKANPNRNAVGTVIEASLDKGRGYVSTILVQNGTLQQGDMVVTGQYFGKVKAMSNERGQRVVEAGPSTPVQVLGLNGAPQAGEKFKIYEDESEGRALANHRSQILREQGLRSRKHITLDEIGRRLALGNFKELNVIIKADVDGSAEALSDSLQKLSTEEIVVNVVLKGVGQISESDVNLASASDAIIIGFQVRPSAHASKLAEQENIEIRQYSIIYDAIAEIKSAMEGMLEPKIEKKVVCNIEVRDIFKISNVGTIAGCYVLDGKVSRNTKINVIRDGIVVHTGELSSLKRFKDDVKEVGTGYECGLAIKGYNDIHAGDVLEGYDEVEVKRKL